MCRRCDEAAAGEIGRRAVLAGAGALATGAGLPGVAGAALASTTGPTTTRAYAAPSATGAFSPIQIQRRAVRSDDVAIDILYCGICHSDIHTVRGEWGTQQYPLVPGHELVGRVVAVGSAVSRFKVGDFAGVGCYVDSCGVCENCRAGLENYCVNRATLTYGSPDKISGGRTQGGYSEHVVVKDHFAIKLAKDADLPSTAPILCSGVTTFSPMQHWKLARGQRFAVVGMGGLGHLALKLAVSRGADTSVFTTTPDKVADARRMGASAVVVWDPKADKPVPQPEALAGRFNLMLSTIPQPYSIKPFLPLLALDATFVNLGNFDAIDGINGRALFRRSVASSLIGGIPETQEVVDYCHARNIRPEIQLVRPDQINEAYDRVRGKQVRYRFVIDLASSRAT